MCSLVSLFFEARSGAQAPSAKRETEIKRRRHRRSGAPNGAGAPSESSSLLDKFVFPA